MIRYQSVINNHRISLRSLAVSDASILMELNNDLDIAKYVVGNPKQVNIQEQMQWVERIATETQTKRFIVEYDDIAVGTVIISNIDLANLTANVNIKLLSVARGKGVGKQSIKLAVQYCFDELGIYCITAHVLSFNKASLALFDSCGFTREGILRSRVIKNNKRCDLISYSIIRSDI